MNPINTNQPERTSVLRGAGAHRGDLKQRCGRHRTLAWAVCFWLAALGTSFGALVVDYDPVTPVISPGSPTLVLTVHNDSLSGPVLIGGLDFFITIELGGPTMSTTVMEGVDLVTGTLFAGGFGQFSIGSQTALSQSWGTLVSPPGASLGAGATAQLATLTFDSFPVGSYAVDFTGTSFYDSFGDPIGVSVILPDLGDPVIVVPEPVNLGLAAFGGLAAVICGVRRWRQGKRAHT